MAVAMVKMVNVLVAEAEAALSILSLDTGVVTAAFAEGICIAFLVTESPLAEADDDVEIDVMIDVEFGAAKAVSSVGLIEVFKDSTLSLSAVPFHKTLHELVLKLVGTESQIRRSFFPRTVKPLRLVALPCTITE
jgi:hypothetical protein